jgi:glycosyltransferase involved in cell wall biosynthesis
MYNILTNLSYNMIIKHNVTASVDPFLSICITSYNRVNELERCLKSIDCSKYEAIEIVISEDCSPQKHQIQEMVELFSKVTKYRVVFNSNETNLGYDCNLGRLIELAEGTYILFMSDDDLFLEKALDKILDKLLLNNSSLAFSPFFSYPSKTYERKFDNEFAIQPTIQNVSKYIYCSILFSGLIFEKNKIINYEAIRFRNLIYFQVYLFASVLFKHGGYYFNIPLVKCIGDGENAFGTSESSEPNAFLADRKSIYSNLEYHKGLIQVIKSFDDDNGTHIIKQFSQEYSLRSYSGLARARKSSHKDLDLFWKRMNELEINIGLISKIYYYALRLFGYTICNFCIRAPKRILLIYRNKLKCIRASKIHPRPLSGFWL